jgi:hypothetical protein
MRSKKSAGHNTTRLVDEARSTCKNSYVLSEEEGLLLKQFGIPECPVFEQNLVS